MILLLYNVIEISTAGIKMNELECKLKINSSEEIICSINALEALYQGKVHEKNWVFERDGELFAQEMLLRLRVLDDNKWGILTHKAPAEQLHYKCKKETETKVEDAEKMQSILLALNYRPEWFYEKHRSKWIYKDCEIVLDIMPVLGAYIEIEGKTEEEIDSILTNLGLNREDNIAASYRQIWREYCLKENIEFCDWKF